MNKVLGTDAGHKSVEYTAMDNTPVVESPMEAQAQATMAAPASTNEEEEDTLSYFDRLAKQG